VFCQERATRGAHLSKNKHIKRIRESDYHRKKKACVVRHEDVNTPCDYRWNGYLHSVASRKPLYNKPVTASSINERRVDRKIRQAAARRFGNRPNGPKLQETVAKFLHYFRTSLSNSRALVDQDPEAWFIGKPGNRNFVPRKHGGPGFHVPYYHNWHHLIPNGAINEHIGGYDYESRSRDEDGYKRLFLLMSSGYNINTKPNIMLLPQESFVGRILRLPVHCPYWQKDHIEYSASCVRRLGDISRMLDQAISEGAEHQLGPEEVATVRLEMRDLSNKLFEIVQSLKPGQNIDTPLNV
jgi:hypothetical protein